MRGICAAIRLAAMAFVPTILGGSAAVAADAGKAPEKPDGYLLLMAIIVLIGIFFWLDKRFPILRDMPPPDSAVAPQDRPYSLSRFQMMIWTCIISTSAIYLYAIKWQTLASPLDVISGSAAILLGISGGAGLVSAAIDSSKDSSQTATQQAADTAATKADAAATVAKQATPGTAEQLKALQSVVTQQVAADDLKQQAEAKKRSAKKHDFFTDILQDDNGNSLHRIQMLAFTAILGVIFYWEVVQSGKMPQFSDQTLGLMGISSGIYAGFKLPESKVKP